MDRLGITYHQLGMLTEAAKWLSLASSAWQRQNRLVEFTNSLRILEEVNR